MPMPGFDVMQQDIYLASYDTFPTGGGAGTWESPYCATAENETDSANATRFDNLMKDSTKIPSGSSVRLLPGSFFTNGHPGTSDSGYWTPSNYMRLTGSGMGATTLKLRPTGGATRFAIGMYLAAAGAGLTGVQLTDLTIDCGLGATPESGTLAGAVRLRGTHLLMHRVKVTNYGGNSSSSTVVPIITLAGEGSENCIISDCVADVPAGGHNCIASLFVFERDTAASPTHNGHRFCAIRNCAARGLTDYEPAPAIDAERVRAIAPGLGLGTIIEGNQIANCAVGVWYNPPGGDKPAKDIVVWNNIFRNVSVGIYFNNESTVTSPAVGRLVLQDNMIELATVGSAPSGTIWRTGIRLNTSQTSTRFSQVVVRKNLIRDVTTPSGVTSGLKGLNLQRCGELIAENNIINNIADTEAVFFQNAGSRKFFNNQNSAGQLLRGYDGSTKVQELEDQVQDVLLPI